MGGPGKLGTRLAILGSFNVAVYLAYVGVIQVVHDDGFFPAVIAAPLFRHRASVSLLLAHLPGSGTVLCFHCPCALGD